MADVREVRKYANRRLYDVQKSRYINRDDLRKLIASGEQVQVVDETSGEDITRSLLLQLLAEQEQGGEPVLSDRILTELIRYYEHPMQAMFATYLQQSMEAFIEQRHTLQGQWQQLLGNMPGTAPGKLAQENLEHWMEMQKSFFAGLGQKKSSKK